MNISGVQDAMIISMFKNMYDSTAEWNVKFCSIADNHHGMR